MRVGVFVPGGSGIVSLFGFDGSDPGACRRRTFRCTSRPHRIARAKSRPRFLPRRVSLRSMRCSGSEAHRHCCAGLGTHTVPAWTRLWGLAICSWFLPNASCMAGRHRRAARPDGNADRGRRGGAAAVGRRRLIGPGGTRCARVGDIADSVFQPGAASAAEVTKNLRSPTPGYRAAISAPAGVVSFDRITRASAAARQCVCTGASLSRVENPLSG